MARLAFRAILGLSFSFCAVSQTPPRQIGSVTVQASFLTRLEVWDWFNGAGENEYAFSGNLLRFGLSGRRKGLDWLVEMAVPFFLDLPANAVAPPPQGQMGLGAAYFAANHNSRNAAMIFPKQAYLGFSRGAHRLRIGRFEFLDGGQETPANETLAALQRDRIAQRLIGPYGFSIVGRSFDGLQYGWNKPGLNFTAIAVLPTRGVFQVNGWRNLDIAVVYAALTGRVAVNRQQGQWRVLGVYYDDWRNVNKTDNVAPSLAAADAGSIRIGTFGGDYIHVAPTPAGPLDALVWGAGQLGRWGSLAQRSAAFAVEGGWQPNGLPRLKPWLRAGLDYGSGDGNPLDRVHGAFFQLLPTPRLYARFPFFNMMNNRDLFVSLILRPRKSVSFRADAHDLRLADRQDLWYTGGGAFQPSAFGYIGRPSGGNHGLANLYDISMDWRLSDRATLAAYYGFAAGRLVIRQIYPAGKNGSFGYIELDYRL
jgi:hypothetical protein